MDIRKFRQHGLYAPAHWLIGAFAVCAVLTTGTSIAWAGANCTAESESEKASARISPADFADALPCDLDSAGYNVCFVANPTPSSALPGWLTEMQAHDAAGRLLADIQHGTDTRLGQAASPAWLEEVVAELRRLEDAQKPGSGCFEGQYDAECNGGPSPAAALTFSSPPPVDRNPGGIELPFQPEDGQWAQRPLVDLRIGPAPEHSSPPDRPPPA